MKQFQFTDALLGTDGVSRSLEEVAAGRPAKFRSDLDALGVGQCVHTLCGYWLRVQDLELQDEKPLSAVDVAECRESALRVCQQLRLERIAMAALQGLLAGSTANVVLMSELKASRINPFARLASDAVLAARTLIAELDKQS